MKIPLTITNELIGETTLNLLEFVKNESSPSLHGDIDSLLGLAYLHGQQNNKSQDAVVEANRQLLLQRSNVGIQKYGVTLEKSNLTQEQYLQHALEEALDLANYLQGELMRIRSAKNEKQNT